MTSRSFASNTNVAMVLMKCYSGTILHFNENHIMTMVSVSTNHAPTFIGYSTDTKTHNFIHWKKCMAWCGDGSLSSRWSTYGH